MAPARPAGGGFQIVRNQNNGMIRFIFPPLGAPLYPKKDNNKHASSYGVVYVNDIAFAGMVKTSSSSSFGPGAVIVREKHLRPDFQKPELLAVMIKRDKGFSRRGNDWEFLILDGAGRRVRHREKTGACLECHSSRRERDFVFKDYEKRWRL